MNLTRANRFQLWRCRSRKAGQRRPRPSAIRLAAARSVILVDVTGGAYAENRPYLLPETLGELTGPVSGIVALPLRRTGQNGPSSTSMTRPSATSCTSA